MPRGDSSGAQVKRLVLAGGLVLVLSAALAAVVVAFPSQRTRAVAAYLLALGILGVAAALAGLLGARRRKRSSFEAALALRPSSPDRLRGLASVENDCVQGLANPVDLHRRLRPRLRRVAAQRLASRHGIDLERRPEAAEVLLGEETWELVRPDRPLPDELTGRRIDADELGRVLDRLEAV